MDYQKSFIRSLSAIHTGELHPSHSHPAPNKADSRRLSRRMSSDIPPLPFGSYVMASEGNKTVPPFKYPRRHSEDVIRSGMKHPSLSSKDEAMKSSKFSRSMQPLRATDLSTQGDSFNKTEHRDFSKIDTAYFNIKQGAKTRDTRKTKHGGFRKDYSLGMVSRKISDMVVEDDEVAAFQSVSSLNNLDFAFVKRTDGQWTYSILAYRFVKTVESVHDEYMTFVLSNTKETKTIRRKKWASYIRLPSAEDASFEK